MPVAPKRNNAQHQPLTTVLRNIIREYPAGGGVLRELCQNADDAEATEVEFVLDTNTYETKYLLHPGLAEYQGPALLAFNNKTFSLEDFESLSRIGDSAKATNLNSTGKFGRGFNSVYNWTDMPSILSGESLLILDPHFTWSREVSAADPGGPVYDFVEAAKEPDMHGQLAAFGSILKNPEKRFEGTIIRLPLRTKDHAAKSKIVPNKSTSEAEIIKAFKTSSGELVESLLFLRNVRKITLRINNDIYAEVESTTSAPYQDAKGIINKGYRKVFVNQEEDICEKDFLMEISLSRGKTHKEIFKFAISHYLKKAAEDEDLQNWARDLKLFPWIAIATPLKGSTNFTGRLFSILPLPVYTKHPVHIHGMFSITPDRQNIHSGGDLTTSENSEMKLGARWNTWLFQECLPHAWTRNLKFLDKMRERGEAYFTGWDFWPAGTQGVERELWMGVLSTLFQRVVVQDLKLLPTICGDTGTRENVLFTLSIDEKYKNALQHARSPVSFPPADRRPELAKLGIETLQLTFLTPSTARNSLSNLRGSLGNLPLDLRMTLLEYVISDKDYKSIGSCLAPLLPTLDGGFHGFGRVGGSKLFFPRTELEVELFKESPKMVDTRKMMRSTVDQMVSDIKKLDRFTAISILGVPDAAWYCKKYIFGNVESKNDKIITRPNFNEFINRFWKWINIPENTSELSNCPQLLNDLWLIPIVGDRYHKVLDGRYSILDISVHKFTSDFFRGAASSLFGRCGIRYPLYTGEGFTIITTDVLRTHRYTEDCENLNSLVGWLVANSKDFVDRLDENEKIKLLSRLRVLSIGLQRDKSSVQQIQRLSLFREVASAEMPSPSWISLDPTWNNCPVKYVGIKGVPVDLRAPGIIFIDMSNDDSERLIRDLGLAACPTELEILENYVIPYIADTRDDTLRASLVEFSFKHFHLLSQPYRSMLSKTEIVPVSTTGATLKPPIHTVSLELAALFFPDENATPIPDFYNRWRSVLIALGMTETVTRRVVLDRIETYSQPNRSPEEVGRKAQKLAERFIPTTATNFPQKYLSDYRWLPAQFSEGAEQLYSAEQCRDRNSEALVKYAMPLTKFEMNDGWREALGWKKPLSGKQLLNQLKGAKNANDTTAILNVIQNAGASLDEYKTELQEFEWIPDTHEMYHRPSNIFLDDFSHLSPYFGAVAPKLKKQLQCKKFLIQMGVGNAPSFKQLKELQDELAKKGVLGEADLKVALSIVKELGERFPNEELGDFKAPDDSGVLRLLTDLTAGDPGPNEAERAILHPGVSMITIKQLRLPTFHDRLLESLNDPDFDADFAQRESPITVINDTLTRYTPSSTFTEYLANAEDASATKISWVLDGSKSYDGTKLLVDKLLEVQGPALFCCNDSLFAPGDFKAIVDIGVGSKRKEFSKIGKFGRGALTMYHWTSVPSFISGDSFVIFDPESKYLPPHPVTRMPRAGRKLKLKDVHRYYPDQLRPFEDIFGFNLAQHTDYFPGTIFRFPLRSNISDSALGDSIDSVKTHQHLMNYFNEAMDSLLFLKNISSISFRMKSSTEPFWEVSSEKVNVPGNPRIKVLTIKGQLKTLLEELQCTCKEWYVISGSKNEEDIPTVSLEKIRKDRRLEARYGLAVPVSKTGDFRGRNYMSLPLRKPDTMEIPAHVDANLAVQSNRQSIPLADSEMEEGSEWNNWIFEKGVAPLYLILVKYLMQTSGANGYHYWPPYPSTSTDTVSRIISTEFWKKAVSSSHELYVSELPSENTRKTPIILEFNAAVFNLLDPDGSKFLVDLLRRFGRRDIVSLPQRIQEGLKACNPKSMKSLSPNFLLDIFRSASYNDILLQVWEEKQFDIEFLNILLSFIVSQENSESIIGCVLLPLSNKTLGTFCLKTMDANFLVAKAPDEREILDFSPSLAVHPGLELSVIETLMLKGKLNIANLQFDDIPRLYKTINKRSTDERKFWIKNMWPYFERCIRESPGKRETYLNTLRNMPVYFGTAIGQPDTHIEFLSPVQFSDFSRGSIPAIVKQSKLGSAQNSMLQAFKGLILLDPSAFPQDHLPSECMSNISGALGVYRFLKSIKSLAMQNELPIEDYIMKTLQTDELESLRELLDPAMMTVLLQSYPESTSYLKDLPIWPSESKELVSYKPATKAKLAPGIDISFTGLTEDDLFIRASVAEKYSNQLKDLKVNKTSLDELLKNHVRPGQTIENSKIQSYKSFILSLQSRDASAFSRYPLAVNGDGQHCMLDTLYDSGKEIFQAAFRGDKTRFLHPSLRDMSIWRISGLRQEITDEIYLECVHSIERRRNESPNEDRQLINDAQTVFKHLSWDDPKMQSWNPGTWIVLRRTSVVTVKTELRDSPEYRRPQMRNLLQDGNFTTLERAVTPEYTNIAWSQSPTLTNQLGSFVRSCIPNTGVPSPETVLRHLVFLSENRGIVAQQEIPAYVADVKACYENLQDRIPSLPPPDLKVKIWFNVNAEDISLMDQSTFQNSWTCSERLCSGLTDDSTRIQYIRTFLIPFARLLDHYRVGKHVPSASLPAPDRTDHPALMLRAFQRFREEGKLFDVTFQVEDQKVEAHRVVMAAASKFWELAFTGKFKEANRDVIIPLEELKPRTVAAVLNYIYTGDVSGVSSLADPSDILQDLMYQLEVSDLWRLSDLKAKLEYQICRPDFNFIRPETVRSIYDLAVESHADSLAKVCKEYILANEDIVEKENSQG